MADTVDKRLAAPDRPRRQPSRPEDSGRRRHSRRSRRRPASSVNAASVFVRRHKLAPYLLLLPALVGIGAGAGLAADPARAAARSRTSGWRSCPGTLPTQWVGLSNFSATLSDPEFWLRCGSPCCSAAVVVALTMLVGTAVGRAAAPPGPEDGHVREPRSPAGLGHPAWSAPRWCSTGCSARTAGIVDWGLSKLPGWLGGGAHWAGFNWTTSGALPAYTVLTFWWCGWASRSSPSPCWPG